MITMSMFINRKEELAKLDEIFGSRRAELVLLYGRRRVGKSRLLTEAIKGRKALYLLADMSENVLDIFAKQVGGYVRFGSWDDFFEFVAKSDYDIIVLDEFQYLYNVNKAWPSILQRHWEKIKPAGKKIVLCGSILSTIYKIAVGYGSALYGRKTREMNIEPLRFRDFIAFFGRCSFEESVKSYFVLGGIPRYMEEFDPAKSLEANLAENLLDKTSFLYNEPINLLFEEFRDFTPYASIILAITEGRTKFKEISDYSHIGMNKLPKYLSVLERVRIIEKELPVSESRPKAKITRYRVKDNFYRFWFRFLFGNRGLIERGLAGSVLREINDGFGEYSGSGFERLCRELVEDLGMFSFTRIGKWWHKDQEIDIVALNEEKKSILFCECKWQDDVNAEKLLAELKEKAKLVDWNKGRRTEAYAIFAKSFGKRAEGAPCIDLKDMERGMKAALSESKPRT